MRHRDKITRADRQMIHEQFTDTRLVAEVEEQVKKKLHQRTLDMLNGTFWS